LLRVLVLPLITRLASRTRSKLDDHTFDILNPALLRSVVLVGAHFAFKDFVADPGIDHYADGVIITLLVLIWGKALLGIGVLVFRQLSEVADQYNWIQPATLPLIFFTFKVFIFALQTYLIMAAWNINLTSWLASAGVLGIAIGFAAKDTLANFISGVFILADAPYQVGQYIVVDGQTRGVVTDIGMRSTRLLTRDNVEVTVPNAVIGNSMVINQSSGPSPHMRVRVTVGVAYGSDVDQVRDVLMACTQDLPHTVTEREASIQFILMGESSLDFRVSVWMAHPSYRGRVVDTLNTRIYKALAEAGIEIPFPQRDLHIKSMPGKLTTD